MIKISVILSFISFLIFNPVYKAEQVKEKLFVIGETSIRMVYVEPGCYNTNKYSRDLNTDMHFTEDKKVCISSSFWIAKFETTNEFYNSFYKKPVVDSEKLKPVRNISWNDVISFIEKLNEEQDSLSFRLPTEAEWEFAGKADSNTDWHFGSDIEAAFEYAWVNENSYGRVQQVGLKKPNAWGLYDIHGNVWEWVSDWFHPERFENIQNKVTYNPTGPDNGTLKVRKGGSAIYNRQSSSFSVRYHNPADKGTGNIGFRLAMNYKITKND